MPPTDTRAAAVAALSGALRAWLYAGESGDRLLDAILASPDARRALVAACSDPTTVREDPEADGSLDDLVIEGGITMFHIERMGKKVWWFAVYLADGSRYSFHLNSSRKISAFYEHEPDVVDARGAAQPYDEADGMCPNCLTPWKCNGPHLYEQTEAYRREHGAVTPAAALRGEPEAAAGDVAIPRGTP